MSEYLELLDEWALPCERNIERGSFSFLLLWLLPPEPLTTILDVFPADSVENLNDKPENQTRSYQFQIYQSTLTIQLRKEYD